MKKLVLTVVLAFANAAHAAPSFLLLFDETDLAPPYHQRWTATPADFNWAEANGGVSDASRHEVYVRGDGKKGDFYGVLYLDCVTPQYSEWLVSGGYLTETDVPPEAIAKLRQELC